MDKCTKHLTGTVLNIPRGLLCLLFVELARQYCCLLLTLCLSCFIDVKVCASSPRTVILGIYVKSHYLLYHLPHVSIVVYRKT